MKVISRIEKVLALGAVWVQGQRRSVCRQLKREAIEVGVLESLHGRDALLRVKSHHLVHQIDRLLTGVWNQLGQ